MPAAILRHPKHGFDVPVSRWVKGRFKGLCEDIIESNHLIQTVFRKGYLQAMNIEHQNGHSDYGRFFWKIIMLHFWAEEFNGENVNA